MATAIKNLSLDQLQDREVINKIWEITQGYIDYRKTHEARELSSQLEKRIKEVNLEQVNPEIYTEYKSIIAKLKFIAISYLTEEEFLNLIKTGALDGLKEEGIDIEERTKSYLLGIIAITNWDNFRRKIITALGENKQKLGPKTVQEWFNDYIQTLGARIHTDIERSNYVGKLTLPPNQGRLLLNLLKFYDSIKISVPLPTIGVSEESLRDYFGEIGYPLSEEGGQILVDYLRTGRGLPPKEKLIPPLKESPRTLPKQPSELLKLRRPPVASSVPLQKPTPPPAKIRGAEETPEEISIYEGRISPYERKSKIPTPTFPTKPEPKPEPRPTADRLASQRNEPQASKPESGKGYQVRTMKQDIARLDARQEKTKKQPIPGKPKPKIKDNIVDLSGK